MDERAEDIIWHISALEGFGIPAKMKQIWVLN